MSKPSEAECCANCEAVKLEQLRIDYEINNAFYRQFELLVYSMTGPMFAVLLPLAGVALGIGELGVNAQWFAGLCGVIVSLVWFVSTTRLLFLAKEYDRRCVDIEKNMGLGGYWAQDRELVKRHIFLKFTPGNMSLRSGLSLFSVVVFLILFGWELGTIVDIWPEIGLSEGGGAEMR